MSTTTINLEHTRNVYETRDYDQFKFMRGNREISHTHVQHIVQSMKLHGNLLDLYPLVVVQVKNGKKHHFEIHDGQHRFMAAKALRHTIFYIIDNDDRMTVQTVIDANAAQQSWSYRDFLASYCIREFPEYLKAREFITRYPLPLGTALQLLAGANHESWALDFKRGNFRVREWDWACYVADTVVDFAQYFAAATSAKFISAVVYLLRNEHYEHKTMLGKMEQAGHHLQKTSDADEYFRQLTEIYNFKTHAKNVVGFEQIDGKGRRKLAGRWVYVQVGEDMEEAA